MGEEYKSFSSSLCNLLHSPVTSSFLGPNILLNTMLSNTLSFLSSRSVKEQVSHQYKATGKIIVVYDYIIYIYIFYIIFLEDPFVLEKPIKFDVSAYVCRSNGNIENKSISVDCSAVVSLQN